MKSRTILFKSLKTLYESALSLAYPPLCLHCEAYVKQVRYPLCEACLELLQFIDRKERCPTCFSILADSKGTCSDCFERQAFHGVASAFEYEGPAASLIKHFKYGSAPYLAEGLAAYLAVLWTKLDWTPPTLLVPIPQTWGSWMSRGYNQSHLLADELGKILSLPVEPLLRRKTGGAAQSSLSRVERLELSSVHFELLKKRRHSITDATIILIDDVITTMSTLRSCADTLALNCPAKIYALSVCRA